MAMNTTVFPRKTIEGLPEIVHRLVEHYHPLKVVLFGSQAWGEPDEDSDVDLFVVKETDEQIPDRRRTVTSLLYETGRVPFAVDVWVYTPQEVEYRLSLGDPFVADILNGGKVLYNITLQHLRGPRESLVILNGVQRSEESPDSQRAGDSSLRSE